MEQPLINWDTGKDVRVKVYDDLRYELEGNGDKTSYEHMLSTMLPHFGRILKAHLGKNFPAPKIQIDGFSQSRRQSYAADIEMNALRYVYFWLQKSGRQSQDGIYDRLAELADIKDGESWLDIGCGGGHLLASVLKRSSPVAFGLDCNEYLIEAARGFLESAGHKVSVNSSYKIAQDRELGWKLEFLPDPNFKAGNVNLVLDDKRGMDVARTLLPKPFDKATYTFAGGMSQLMNYEIALMPMYMSFPEIIQDKVVEHAIRNAADILRPGGELIVANPALVGLPWAFDKYGLETVDSQELPYCVHFATKNDFFYQSTGAPLPEGTQVPLQFVRLRKK